MDVSSAKGYGRNLSHGDFAASPSDMSIDNLLPALLECFGIILCGYIAGRAHVITSSQAKGLGNFVSKFALPALLFKNMVLLDFDNVIWPFLWSVLIAKVSVFLIVCVLTLLAASPDSRFAKAGLFSIFATQSNDFALGYPIVEALYRNTYPEYLQYIYLVAPVSLVILNPIGFALCEIQKWRDHREQQQTKLQVLGVVLLQVLKNPIVFMVVVGLASHFLLRQRVPLFMGEFVDGLANSFGGAALFYLGLTMVGQLGKLTKSTVVALILLITAKLLVMPLICRDMVELLDAGSRDSLNHSSLSNYAFLYGVFPTAPSVALYAAQYNMEIQVVTSGMVICTFLSAPIMYVSAWLLTIPRMDSVPMEAALQSASFNISVISLVALIWTIAVMFLSKKFKRLPHMFSMNFFLAQFLVCVGMIVWNFVVKEDSFLGKVLSFTLLYSSLYSAYVWPGLIALSLVLMKRNEDLGVAPGILVVIGWGVPVILVAVLLVTGEKMPDTIDSAFFYGKPQVICTAVVLTCSIVLAGGSLMALSKGTQDPTYRPLERVSSAGIAEDAAPQNGLVAMAEPEVSLMSINRGCSGCGCVPSQPMPDMIVSTNMSESPPTQPGQCDEQCDPVHCLLVQEEQMHHGKDPQVARHVLLCLLLMVGLLANISSCLWWLFNSNPGRLYLELQFFCVVVNYGQGFISFGIFGLDKHLIILPFKRRLSRLWNGRQEEEQAPPRASEEARITCAQFIRYHKDQCVHDIVQKKRCGERTVADTFLGSELVDWLLRAGLARDRGEALFYGTQLQEGGLLQHITQEYGFRDEDLHFRFKERGATGD